MSKLPQVKKLLVEDFLEQKDWISKLFQPLNLFMDGVLSILNRGLTIKENLQADIKTVTLDRVPTEENPMNVQWGLKYAPVSVHIGNIAKERFSSFNLAAAVNIQWLYDGQKGLRITNIVGLTPTGTDKYILTLVIFTG
jgi:hypothetical protein